jgi:hypothetical protein
MMMIIIIIIIIIMVVVVVARDISQDLRKSWWIIKNHVDSQFGDIRVKKLEIISWQPRTKKSVKQS